jgi:hypothetical protein
MKQLIIIITILSINLHAELKTYFLSKDSAFYSAKEEILDSTWGNDFGKPSLTFRSKTINYLGDNCEIYKVTNSSQSVPGIMVVRTKLSIAAYVCQKDFKTYLKKWEIDTNYSAGGCSCEFDKSNCFIVTIQQGCCGTENLRSFYSKETGKLIAKGTSDPFYVTTDLWLTYYGNQGIDFNNKDRSINGYIYLFDQNKIYDTVIVRSFPWLTWTPLIKILSNDDKSTTGRQFILIFDEGSYKLNVNDHDKKIIIPNKLSNIFFK